VPRWSWLFVGAERGGESVSQCVLVKRMRVDKRICKWRDCVRSGRSNKLHDGTQTSGRLKGWVEAEIPCL
jgi:hypothetical protein